MTDPRLPGRLRAPVALQTVHYGLWPEDFFARAQQRHGDVFTVRILGETWTVLGHPHAVKEVFALGPAAVNSGEPNLALRPLLGTENVLLLDGDEHLARRKLVLPPFHGERMRSYGRTIQEAIRTEVAAIPLGQPVALLPHMQSLTFAVIMRCVFGLEDGGRLRSLGEAMRQMIGWITEMRGSFLYGVLGPDRVTRLRSFRKQIEAAHTLLDAEIQERRRVDDLSGREDILSLLIQARDADGAGLSDEELRDELVTLLVAGHETTATVLGWAVHALARDDQSQERLVAEPEQFGDAVITETLRLRPPVPVVLRRLLEPRTIAGHQLPAGATLAPCTLLVHRRPDLYPDPWRFDPTRFLDRRPAGSEWFPFGGSVRRCLGAAFAQFEARMVLAELSRSLQFRPERVRSERVGRRGPVLVPGRGARVIASRR